MNLTKLSKIAAIVLLAIGPAAASETSFSPSASYATCFVPDGNSCERLLVDAMNRTKNSLLIQAYSFTSPVLAKAVVDAHRRGVDVRVILDESQMTEKYTSATFLRNSGVTVLIDSKPAIAHNKVMIFDQSSVFTGSYNFTRSAESRNTENGVIIAGDKEFTRRYLANWVTRQQVSKPYPSK